MQSQKLLIGLLVVAILGFVAYKFVFSSAADTGTVSDTASSSVQDSGQQILDAVDKLGTVNIDGSLFSSGLFTHLKDFSTPINPESQGRSNPFADIGSGSTYSAQQQGTSSVSGVSNTTNSANKTSANPAASKASQGKSSEI